MDKVQMKSSDDPAPGSCREGFIAGLRALADFFSANPAVPVPYWIEMTVFADGDSEAEYQAEVDRIAAALGTHAADERGAGRYTAARSFGPVAYKAVAVTGAGPGPKRAAAWSGVTS